MRLPANDASPMKSLAAALALLLIAAFGLRLGLGLALRRGALDRDSYHLKIAREIVAGRGHVMRGSDWTTADSPAFVTPLYQMLLAGVIMAFGENESLIAAGALVGTATVGVVFLLGRELFSEREGLAAAAATAFYPYYAVNDTGLIDRGLYTLSLAIAVWASLKAYRANSARGAFLAGTAWAAAALVRSSGVLCAPFIAVWFWGSRSWSGRRGVLLAALACGLAAVLAPWLVRNASLYGRPVFVSQGGLELWGAWVGLAEGCGYPETSVDRCLDMAYAKLPQASLDALKNEDDLGQDAFFRREALGFIRREPGRVLMSLGSKLRGAFSPVPNPRLDRRLRPRRGTWTAAAHAAPYAAILAAALAGLWRWRRRPEIWVCACPFAAFTVATLVFWSHTAHRAAFDFLLIVLASGCPLPWSLEGTARSNT